MQRIWKVVVTGGPCGGKSSGLARVRSEFEARGYAVLVVGEAATELINGGVAPWTCGTHADFQSALLGLQLAKEKAIESAAVTMDRDVLIVCDRGTMDGAAYVGRDAFKAILAAHGLNEVEARDGYDGVFHLVSAARGAETHYTCLNNGARTEDAEQAAALDLATIDAWCGHPHQRIIGNDRPFEAKMDHLVAQIASLMGDPEPLEVERRFLIRMPDPAAMAAWGPCRPVQIAQTYLNDAEGKRMRLRRRGADGAWMYYETRKERISETTRIEVERRLDADEYLRLMEDARTPIAKIRKTRYNLVGADHVWEVDVLPFWDDVALAEVELMDEDEEFTIPECLEVIREVTCEPGYTNYQLALAHEGC